LQRSRRVLRSDLLGGKRQLLDVAKRGAQPVIDRRRPPIV
jgi:hypothetical protein